MDDQKYLAIRDSYIVKSNDLIQKSRFKLSLQQQRIVLFICSQIKQTDEDFKRYTVPLRDFLQICGIENIGGKCYKEFEEVLDQLEKPFTINLTPTKRTSVKWVLKWTYDTDAASNTAQILIDPDLKPYLLQLRSNYTKYEYIYTLLMSHRTTPRLYELLKSYHYNKLKPFDKEFSVDELRSLLDSEAKSYQQFRYFRTIILEPSIAEINRLTDIFVSASYTKPGRKVTSVVFHIEPKDPADILETVGKIYDKLGYKYFASSQADTSADSKNTTQEQQKQPVNESIQPDETPVESSESKPRMDAEKPLQEPVHEPENVPAEQQPEREQIQESAAAAVLEQEQEPSRIQVRIYVGKKRIKSPSKAPDKREELDAIVKKFLLDNNLEPLEPFEHSEGASFRLNCRRKES